MNSIKKTMDKEHKKISEILDEFEKKANKNSESSSILFEKFKWSLKKHFFTEEKIIFDSLSIKFNEPIQKLLDEHKEILDLVEKAGEQLTKNKRINISLIKQKLKSHANLEDNVFYPKLDELLDEKQKQGIIYKSKEIIIN